MEIDQPSFPSRHVDVMIRLLSVPLGASGDGTSGDEKPLHITVTGDPAGSMPANTHLFPVFFGNASPCLFRPTHLSC